MYVLLQVVDTSQAVTADPPLGHYVANVSRPYELLSTPFSPVGPAGYTE